jgi:hypothetical protein
VFTNCVAEIAHRGAGKQNGRNCWADEWSSEASGGTASVMVPTFSGLLSPSSVDLPFCGRTSPTPLGSSPKSESQSGSESSCSDINAQECSTAKDGK